jgi:hypothetical protein
MSGKDEKLSKEKEQLALDVEKVTSWVYAAAENGLFLEQNVVCMNSILTKLNEATEDLGYEPPKTSLCQLHLGQALDQFYGAVNHTSTRWRFLYMYAGHIWSYLIGWLVLVFVFYFLDLGKILALRFDIPTLATDATAWGVIGGLLQGLWYLWKNVDMKLYRRVWMVRFISTPLIGGVLGAIVYLMIVAGLLILSENKANVLNPTIVIVASALAGFNWTWAVDQLDKLRGRLLS